jgi:hypothetical protein
MCHNRNIGVIKYVMEQRMVIRSLAFLILIISYQTMGQDRSLGERLNVMECSHAEVLAYMDLPNPERRAMSDFDNWQSALKATEVTKSELDPSVCLGTLYGDLGIMAERLKASTSAFLAMERPSIGQITDKVMEELSGSICARLESTTSNASSSVMAGYNSIKNKAKSELSYRYGKRAMEKYVTNALIAPQYQDQGLKYRNGEIDADAFRRSTRNRWKRDLDELRDDAVDNAAGN